MRQTKQKDIILRILHEMGDHPTAEEVYAALKPDYPRLSLATVYRNLNLFVEQGKLLKVELPSEPVRYDIRLPKHIHAICTDCHAIVDIPAEMTGPLLGQLEDLIGQSSGFAVDDMSILVKGRCQNCQARQQSSAVPEALAQVEDPASVRTGQLAVTLPSADLTPAETADRS
ncbi:transcriptional repressor [Oscillospiraceae bacterium HV4-5-C5C]|nr:transcriptional repressor [Oscillospiraceae bacterium HV4-5-C5C]